MTELGSSALVKTVCGCKVPAVFGLGQSGVTGICVCMTICMCKCMLGKERTDLKPLTCNTDIRSTTEITATRYLM